jgi:hypothetical protein
MLRTCIVKSMALSIAGAAWDDGNAKFRCDLLRA